MKPRCFSLLLVVLLLAGCANLGTIRQSDPVNTLVSDRSPKELANAIAYKSQGSLDSWNRGWDPAQVTEISGTYRLLITLTPNIYGLSAAPKPMAEITITPTASGGSRLEYRAFSHWFAKDRFWDLIQHCASPQKA